MRCLLFAQSGHSTTEFRCPLMIPSGHWRFRIAAVQTGASTPFRQSQIPAVIPSWCSLGGKAMRRRDFIRGIIGSATAFPLAVEAQQAERVRRIGVMMGYAETDPAAQAQVAALRQGLQKLGWEEGRNIHVDVRYPGGDASAVRTALMELMRVHTGCVGHQHQPRDGSCSWRSSNYTDRFHKHRRSSRFWFC